ncbi:MAG TPA: hypothetical protein VGP68_13885 [Gemmataceae bacterium]|jgi:hypothetical protein|nr:hypothetical protein [Gemmataceae bacterium]
MRRSAFAFVLISLTVFGAQVRADEAAEARSLVEEAVKAHGGATALAQLKLMTRLSSGTMFLLGQEAPFRDELVVSLPTKWRWNLETGAAGRQTVMTLIMNGNNAWQGSGLLVAPMPQERVGELQDESQVLWLGTLMPLLQEKDLQLGLTKDVDVNGKPAHGIRVSRANKSEIKLYFDGQTHLLVKIARRAREAGIDIDKEYFYGDHQAVQGVMMPKRYSEWTSGRKLVDVNSISYKFHDKLDDKLFEKP